MKKCEIWTVASGEHTGKPRPCIIAQDDGIESYDTIVIMPITSFRAKESKYRILINATPDTGLYMDSFIEVEKISAIRKKYLGEKIGELSAEGFSAFDKATSELLGLSE